MALSEIDVRGLSPDRGAACAREALAALGPGESVVMMGDADPEPVLARLRSPELEDVQRCTLENAAGVSAVELRRRDGTRSLEQVLHFEHERLDRLIAEVEWRLAQHRTHDAAARFAFFRAALERHVDAEERVLLPIFRRSSGEGDSGVAAVLEDEHAVMRALLRRIDGALHRTDAGRQDSLSAIADLRELLAPHAQREEQVVCRNLTAEEGVKVARQLHEMRPL